MDCRAFWLAKRGNSPEEYEDAFQLDAERGRFAVADGATESVFAASWAQSLVRGFVSAGDDAPPHPLSLCAWLPELQQQWLAEFSGRELPWYAEVKLEQGAFAAFLGLVVTACRRSRWRWRAIAVGDTCLFHTRGSRLLKAFPVSKPDEFSNFPGLVGSRMPVEVVDGKRAVRADGRARAGDRLWLATDALAQWFLNQHEAGDEPWSRMEALVRSDDASESFAAWIEKLRDAKELHNDDVTLLAVPIGRGS